MKIIFLDIDGVLCTGRSHLAMCNPGDPMRALDPVGVRLIDRACTEAGAKIVVASTWGHVMGRPIQDLLVTNGFTWKNFFKDSAAPGDRPSFITSPVMRGLSGGGNRGEEIADWLEAHPEVTRYAIIDDMPVNEEQRPYHIKTNPANGFSTEDYHSLRHLLMAEGFTVDYYLGE